jgi:two-component system response regulator
MNKSSIEKRFGLAVKDWRERLRLSQDELATRAGLHRSYVSDLERGTRNISLKSIGKIAEAMRISIWNLFAEFNDQAGAQPLTTDEMVDILLVEDQPNDAELTLAALKDARVTNRIFVVRDGAAALDFLFATGSFSHRRPHDLPQIILLDLHLPGINGLEVLRRIKADARTRAISVVMLTGSQEEHDIVMSKKFGAETYIVKPVNAQNFSAAALRTSLHWALQKPDAVPERR